jgi:hypothetical protein
VGEITMDNELLYAKIEALEGKRPLAHRRSRLRFPSARSTCADERPRFFRRMGPSLRPIRFRAASIGPPPR